MQVVDYDKSERGPQRQKSADGRLIHCCCVCGKADTWGRTWTAWCSDQDVDEGKLFPKFCSEPCRAKGGPEASLVTRAMLEKAKAGEMRPARIVYREATTQEKWAAAVARQRDR